MSVTPIFEAVYAAIRESNGLMQPDQRLVCTPETVLLGEEGTLDSLGLINLLVLIEEEVGTRLGRTVTLLDERHMSPGGPFTTVGSLIRYIEAAVE